MVLCLADFMHRADAKTMFRIENRWLRWSAYSVVGFVIMQRFSNPASFIYFQFECGSFSFDSLARPWCSSGSF